MTLSFGAEHEAIVDVGELDRPLAESKAILAVMSVGYEVVEVRRRERVQGPPQQGSVWRFLVQTRRSRRPKTVPSTG